MLKVYSQNDETYVLEVLENRIFSAAQPWWEDLNILKILPWVLQMIDGISVSFLNKKRVANLKISGSTIIRCSQNLREEIGNRKKSNMLWRYVQTR